MTKPTTAKGFLADLLQAAPYRVDVDGAGADQVPAEPGNPGAAVRTEARVALAEPERLLDSRSAHIDELGEVGAQRRIHLGHQHQAGRNRLAAGICGLRQHEELGEVQAVHAAKGEQAVGLPAACGLREPVAQRGHLLRRDRRPDRHAKLVRHAGSPRCGTVTANPRCRPPAATAGTRWSRRGAPGEAAGSGAARRRSLTSAPPSPFRWRCRSPG